ncbi:Uncharacterised protein [Clostridium fallax]|uniref:Uncharacterized protein n=2 Tax=Clostridium fallax TaxID=1533 RepID=A0A1M4UJ20_9CLOT|nr:hypothetical protein SAMN05443638_10539 [Clostridium fallax]SQB07584.1 Uncharacterised protein [Clostridium fallax]
MIFLLIIIGAILIIFNMKALKKENKNFDNVFNEKIDNITEVNLEIGELRREFGETIFELQCDIEKLKKENLFLHNELLKINGKSFDNKRDHNFQNEYKIDENEAFNLKELDNKNQLDNMAKDKVDKIKELLDKGLRIDEICQKTSSGKGEVLLIKGLYKK